MTELSNQMIFDKSSNHSLTRGCFAQESKRALAAETAEIAECAARTAVRAVPLLCAPSRN